ncbi:TPA: metal-sulfur cluster assembly factor [Candidatus Micrarchaeota archaeon]|nr:MAG: hypothetical protein AUJ65_02980 [Candidatus Micrarchaeota archaeon CG1_02_51_15]HII38910.1 metal-sulfur cluster assembly factor [Candidatus Micrarchaeota archaeon]
MVSEKQVRDALKKCLYPEIGENLVDLGLIYLVDVNGNDVKVKMTLTTPHCPMHAYMTKQVQEAVEALEGIGKVDVQLVWEPAWTPELMSEETKKRLGFTK